MKDYDVQGFLVVAASFLLSFLGLIGKSLEGLVKFQRQITLRIVFNESTKHLALKKQFSLLIKIRQQKKAKHQDGCFVG